ncbi:MAG: DUF4407 domain-containing protein, partial [Nitrospinae bacterium]|nr:DUF4407 domain-containing protein [Nitrospinota bacterium]
GASGEIINLCPEFEKIKYASIGATIFFTSLLAFISSFYGLSQIFESYVLVFFLALFWGIIIFNLDRYIVQSLRSGDSTQQSLLISLPRIILAVLVAIIISKPLEVKLFEDEINALMLDMPLRRQTLLFSATYPEKVDAMMSSVLNQPSHVEVEEQNATTNEMSRNVAEAAKGVGEIAENISGVSTAASETTQGSSQTRDAANELSKLAVDLQGLVTKFKI